jgi:hypothetical protein
MQAHTRTHTRCEREKETRVYNTRNLTTVIGVESKPPAEWPVGTGQRGSTVPPRALFSEFPDRLL